MEIVLIAHNIRSIYNLGSIFRSAEGFGVKKIYLSGWTANWHSGLPHIKARMGQEIHKTALGAEKMVNSEYIEDVVKITTFLKRAEYQLIGLEQDDRAKPLPDYLPSRKIALLIGEEVAGIAPNLRKLCDDLVEIPMRGSKESFNVAVATGIALYHFTTTQAVS
jgi:tRNA G18 (ribose-2'-O)-methylase SpoU